MRQFESSLRRGLMDANLAQYERVLQNADAAEVDFSPSYLRERMRLLADPWGWMRRREAMGPRRRRRLNWRMIAIVAALLLLSACAYAVVTGQFSQWFPRLEPDPRDPEVSEEVLSRMGTVIEQSQTVDGVTATLNAAVWDGNDLRMSLTLTAPDIPQEVTQKTHLYTEECTLSLPEEDWKEYVRKDEERHYQEFAEQEGLSEKEYKEGVERSVQRFMDMGQTEYWNHYNLVSFPLVSREEDTLTFEAWVSFADCLERPEITLHLENIATYEDGKGEVTWHDGKRTGPGPKDTILKGPMDFTFTLEEPIRPIHYRGDVSVTAEEIPFRFTEFEISVFDMNLSYEVLVPVNEIHVTRPGEPEPEPDPDKLDHDDATRALHRVVEGLWTEDGTFVDLSQRGGGSSMTFSEEGVAAGSVGAVYPYPIDPATVTAVKLGGVRVELSQLTRLVE